MEFIDPYPWQLRSQKRVQINRDIKLLSEFFDLPKTEIIKLSQNFKNRTDEFFKLIWSVRFWEYVNSAELKKDARVLKLASIVFVIEGIFSKGGKIQKVTHFFKDYLSNETKIRLLYGVSFSKKYHSGEIVTKPRHLWFDLVQLSDRFDREIPSYCCSDIKLDTCDCGKWLIEQEQLVLDNLIEKFAKYFYRVRCSIAHDATPVMLGYTEKRPADFAYWSMSVVGSFSHDKGWFMFDSGLSMQDFTDCLKEGLLNYLKDPRYLI